jgi:hypothetical protein
MAYTIVTGSTAYPSNLPYQQINLTGNIILSWPIAYNNDIISDQNNLVIALPDATLASPGQTFRFNNVSIYNIVVNKNDNTFLANIAAGSIIEIYIYDVSTQGGSWRVISPVGAVNAIVNLTAKSTDGSIKISDGDVSPPGGDIDFTLPETLTSLTEIETTGLVVINGAADPVTWRTAVLTQGSNITISNEDGEDGDPQISLNSSLTALDSVKVGYFEITGQQISPTDASKDLKFLTIGDGDLNLNGVLIDSNGNVTIDENLAVNGNLENPFIPKAYVTFTHVAPVTSGTPSSITDVIVITDYANISSVEKTTDGYYKILFTTPIGFDGYGVFAGFGSTGTNPEIPLGWKWVARDNDALTIKIFDATSGELVIDVPGGVSIMVMASGIKGTL